MFILLQRLRVRVIPPLLLLCLTRVTERDGASVRDLFLY